MSATARAVIVLAILGAIAAAWWKFDRMLAAADAAGYKRHQQEAQALADQQAQSNRDLQRAAELRYTVQAGVREEFITQTVTEVRYVTNHLAACPVGPAGVLRLNAAAQCAREDRPAACGPGEPLRGPPGPSE